jgi:hypothetical protein
MKYDELKWGKIYRYYSVNPSDKFVDVRDWYIWYHDLQEYNITKINAKTGYFLIYVC